MLFKIKHLICRVGLSCPQIIYPLFSEPLVAWTGQHPWLHPGWKTVSTRIGYCFNTNCNTKFNTVIGVQMATLLLRVW